MTTDAGYAGIVEYAFRSARPQEWTYQEQMRNAAEFLPKDLYFEHDGPTRARGFTPDRRQWVMLFASTRDGWKLIGTARD